MMEEENEKITKEKESEVSHMSECKYIDEECFNEDLEESTLVEKRARELRPYFSRNTLPTSLYLQQNALPLIYEALAEVEKVRPKDPIEFFCAYILEHNKTD